MSWVVHDRKKFGGLVKEIKDLVDSLHGITNSCVPVSQQAGTIKRKITNISDAETLSLIAEVCSEDHPDIADAASTRADTISLASTHQRHVAVWAESVHLAQVDEAERMSPDLESLTVTELKHKVLELIQERKEREASSAGSSQVPLATSPNAAPLNPGNLSDQSCFGILPNSGRRQNSIIDGYDGLSDPAARSNFSDTIKASGSFNFVGNAKDPDIDSTNIYADAGSHAEQPYASIHQSLQSAPSVSSYSTSSVYGHQNYIGSASGSAVDATESSSITSDNGYGSFRCQTLPRPTSLVGANMPPPQSMMGQVSPKVASSSQKKHKCKICDKRFTRPSSLQTHMYMHTGEKRESSESFQLTCRLLSNINCKHMPAKCRAVTATSLWCPILDDTAKCTRMLAITIIILHRRKSV